MMRYFASWGYSVSTQWISMCSFLYTINISASDDAVSFWILFCVLCRICYLLANIKLSGNECRQCISVTLGSGGWPAGPIWFCFPNKYTAKMFLASSTIMMISGVALEETLVRWWLGWICLKMRCAWFSLASQSIVMWGSSTLIIVDNVLVVALSLASQCLSPSLL